MRKIWILSAIAMLIITFYQINTTYAKYMTEVNVDANEQIGKWLIKVNEQNIATNNQVETFTINQLKYNSSNNVLAGKIAPGLEGYFEINIDASESSVAIIYNVTLDFSKLNISNSIKFSKLVKVLADNTETEEGIIRTSENTYTGTVLISEEANTSESRIEKLKVYVEWEDDKTGINDENDTKLGTLDDGVKIEVPVEVKVSQYLGEEIQEYKEGTI